MSTKRPGSWLSILLAFAVAVGAMWALTWSPQLARFNEWCLGGLAVQGTAVTLLGDDGGEKRWLEWRAPRAVVEPARALVVDADPQRFFERLPPPPADWMVVLDRLHKQDVGAVGMGFPLSWVDPDPLAVEAMFRVMDRHERVVLGTALKDGTLPVPVPGPYLRASVPLGRVTGDASRLPVVSGSSGAPPIWGGERTWAGFLRLETELEGEGQAFLLARWSNRIVFALPLVMEMSRLQLDPAEDVEIVPGREIVLGRSGPRIPIDERGRVSLAAEVPPLERRSASAVIAETLEPEFLQAETPLYVIDQRLLASPVARDFAVRLESVDRAIRASPLPRERQGLHTPSVPVEMSIYMALACGGSLALGRVGWLRLLVVPLLFAVVSGGVLGLLLQQGWQPVEPVSILAMAASFPLVAGWGRRRRRTSRIDPRWTGDEPKWPVEP